MPPDPPISFCTSRGSLYKRSVPMLCPSNGDVLATPLEGSLTSQPYFSFLLTEIKNTLVHGTTQDQCEGGIWA